MFSSFICLNKSVYQNIKSRPTHISASICSLYFISTGTKKVQRKRCLSRVTEHEKVKGEAGRLVTSWTQKNTEFRFHWAVFINEVNHGARTGISSVHSLSHVKLFATPWTAAHQASLSITNSQSLLELMSIKSVMPSDHLILCHPLSSIFSHCQHQGLFWWVSSSYQVAKVLEFLLQHQFENSGLISFRIDWLHLLAIQETLKSLLQHHSSKASILRHSAFFIIQLSHPYMTTGKTIPLTRWTFVVKVMSLLFNMLYRLIITFLPRSKHLLISWLQSPTAMILKNKKIQSLTVSTVSPAICHEVMGPDAMIVAFWMLCFKPTFSLSSFTFIKTLFSSSSLSAIRVVSSAYLKLIDISPSNLDSSWCFIQPGISHDVLGTEAKQVLLFLYGTSLLYHVQF